MITTGQFNINDRWSIQSFTGQMTNRAVFQQPRVLKWQGQPVDISDGLVAMGQVTAYNSATGLYTLQIQTGNTSPAFMNTPNSITAYDRAQLTGDISKTNPRFETDDYVLVERGANVNVIIDGEGTYPSTFVFDASDSGGAKISTTDGKLQFLGLGHVAAVSAITKQSVSDNYKIYIRYDASSLTAGWTYEVAANYPTDAFCIPLAAVNTTGSPSYISNITYYWHGGDIVVPETFPVTLEEDGGSAGDSTAVCDFTYTVTACDGATIMTSASPEMLLATRLIPTNNDVTAATQGTARFQADGSFMLWDANETISVDNELSDIVPCSDV